MYPQQDRQCPSCGGREFEVDHLGNPATAWKVTFGNRFFKKKELQACACTQCGFVSLFVVPEREHVAVERMTLQNNK